MLGSACLVCVLMNDSSRPRSRNEFQIAVICALQVERDAVEALLDEEYNTHGLAYGKAPGDQNAYTLGRISRHYVVLAYMPGMGKANAAATASGIRSSFENIRLALIVGICGGAPQATDGSSILLGDVVISTSVLQTDFVRQYPDKSIMKDVLDGNLGPPNQEIRSFIARASGHLVRTRLTEKTARYCTKLCRMPAFRKARYPDAGTDRLYAAEYRHKHQLLARCDICDACLTMDDAVCEAAPNTSCAELGCEDGNLVDRARRSESEKPLIHFGPFASGDTVMKSGHHRDKLIRAAKVIAFEMEGAGTWHILPTIVVKSVCDYADSHKNKAWQSYSAVASAACMKALLEEWIGTGLPPEGPTSRKEKEKKEAACLRSLSFDAIDDRQHDIRPAHQATCDWLLTKAVFGQWLSRRSLKDFNGVLWIKGKPGAGKSTLMKHAYIHCQKQLPRYTVAAYFFNARGDDILEKSPLGMFRSILYQLLDENRHLLDIVLPSYTDKLKKHGENIRWTAGELKDLLRSIVQSPCVASSWSPRLSPTLLFIDALDECEEREVRGVVGFLEELSVISTNSKTPLSICLSSRHYPMISMKKHLQLIVETQVEHDIDISRYVKDKLNARELSVERNLVLKAQGIFMWTILVVEMLNQAFDEGELTGMQEKMRDIPGDLDEVFRMLLEKDNAYKKQTILLLLWVLFTKRPLTVEELHRAVLAGTSPEKLLRPDGSSAQHTIATRFITNVSRGLVEAVNLGSVRFIHESVKDFLLESSRLVALDSSLACNTIASSHTRLFESCYSYIKSLEYSSQQQDDFLVYAAENLFEHLQEVILGGNSVRREIRQLSEDKLFQTRWNKIPFAMLEDPELVDLEKQLLTARGRASAHPLIEDKLSQTRWDRFLQAKPKDAETMSLEKRLLYFLAARGNALAHLLIEDIVLELDIDLNFDSGPYGTALSAATLKGKREFVRKLLDVGADPNARGGYYGNALQTACAEGYLAIVQMLIDGGADPNMSCGHYGNALQVALSPENVHVERLRFGGKSYMEEKSEIGKESDGEKELNIEEAVHLLLSAGADVNADGGYYGRPLQAAAANPHVSQTVFQRLLTLGADVHAIGGVFGNALTAAISSGSKENIQILLDAGAVVDIDCLAEAMIRGDQDLLDRLRKIRAQRVAEAIRNLDSPTPQGDHVRRRPDPPARSYKRARVE